MGVIFWVCSDCPFTSVDETHAIIHSDHEGHELLWMYDDGLGDEFEAELDQWEAGRD